MEKKIVQIVQSVIDQGTHKLHEPWIKGREAEYSLSVLQSGHLSAGKFVERFEGELAAFIGAKHCVAVINGTAALHILAILRKEHTRNYGKFYVPSLTFVATANAISYTGTTLHFTDFGTYADVAVDIWGHPSDDESAWIKDSAQALGSKRHGKYIGSSRTGIFSFNQNKIITGGSGGIIYTDNDDVAKQARHLSTTARIPHAWDTLHDRVAYNYRMSDLTAAVLCAQLEQLPLILKAKRALAAQYRKAFSSKEFSYWDEPPGCESNFWLNAVMLDNPSSLVPCLKALHNAGIQAKACYDAIHTLPMYKDCERDAMPVTEDYASRTILLPSSPALGMKFI